METEKGGLNKDRHTQGRAVDFFVIGGVFL